MHNTNIFNYTKCPFANVTINHLADELHYNCRCKGVYYLNAGVCKDLNVILHESFPAFIVAGYSHYVSRRASFALYSRRRKLASWHEQSPGLWHFPGGLRISTTPSRDIWRPSIGSALTFQRKGFCLPARLLARWSPLCQLARFAAHLPSQTLVFRAAL